jgi:hypothetical protein
MVNKSGSNKQHGRQDMGRGDDNQAATGEQMGDAGVRNNARGQPPGGQKDARGLSRDGTMPGQSDETPVPGDAARGPWKPDTKHKGD